MDFLSKKHEFTFINNKKSIVRVHVMKVSSTPFDIWVEGRSKKYRDCVQLLSKALSRFKTKDLPTIIVVANNKIGSGGISSYNHNDDVIYFNSHYHTEEQINKIANREAFAAQNLSDIIQHELGHKQHWDAIKRFYHAHKSRYNNIDEAKHQFDSDLESYIVRQNPNYLYFNLSPYASESFKYAKKFNKINTVNEVIAEFKVIKQTSDSTLNKLIESELNYGKA